MELPEAKVAGCDRRLFRFRKAKAGAFAYNAGMHVEMIGPSHSAGRETYRFGVSACRRLQSTINSVETSWSL